MEKRAITDNQIHEWDCIDVMASMPNKSIDLILTDPPYQFKMKSTQGGGVMSPDKRKTLEKIEENFWLFFDPIAFLEQSQRVLKCMNMYIFTNKHLLKTYIEFAEKNGYSWDILLWKKTNPIPLSNNHYFLDKEYIFFMREKGAFFNSSLSLDNYFTIQETSIGSNNDYDHPTQKPIQLILNKILVSSKRWQIILDPYWWTGTTAVGCIELERKFIIIEKNPVYVEIIKKRIQSTTPPLFTL